MDGVVFTSDFEPATLAALLGGCERTWLRRTKRKQAGEDAGEDGGAKANGGEGSRRQSERTEMGWQSNGESSSRWRSG